MAVYIENCTSKSLKEKADKAFSMLESCCLCPRKCGVNRLKNETGFCKTGLKPKIYSAMLHHGEEPPISGSNGSGTIFFSCCTMACVYCQNYEFSQRATGEEMDAEKLAGVMLQLQEKGAHNINLVTPTHVIPHILKTLCIAASKGLKIPLVYNSSGYELKEIIRMLENIMDIYLPDMRYADNELALKYSCARDYVENNQESIKEMHRQTGIPVFDEKGVIKKGLIIRHLVLPNHEKNTKKILKFIAQKISKDTYISLMSQYTPYYKAKTEDACKEINRRLTHSEYNRAKASMRHYGLNNGWIQESFGLQELAGVNIKPHKNLRLPPG